MDWSKVDAPLASALAGAAADEPLSVFVQIDPSSVDKATRRRLRLTRAKGDMTTMTLPAAGVAALTDEAWVRRVRLSATLRPLGAPDVD